MVTAKNIYTYIALRLFHGSDKKYKTKKIGAKYTKVI